MKKILALILAIAISLVAFALPAFATESLYNDKYVTWYGKECPISFEETRDYWYAEDEHGEVPTRKGVILVAEDDEFYEDFTYYYNPETDLYTDYFDCQNGLSHVAIVYDADTIVHATGEGVVFDNNDWKTKVNRGMMDGFVGLAVNTTTIEQDAEVAEWCMRQLGKKNPGLCDIDRRDVFYCAHLIYAGFKDLCDVDLNMESPNEEIVIGHEFVDSGYTSVIYAYHWSYATNGLWYEW